MLLEGKLFLYPGRLTEAVRPWFFVATASGDPSAPVRRRVRRRETVRRVPRCARPDFDRRAGAAYHTVREAFDARTGVVASGLRSGVALRHRRLGVPLVRAGDALEPRLRRGVPPRRPAGRRRTAVVAGALVGAAFFARPYTAVLFARPSSPTRCGRSGRGTRRGHAPVADRCRRAHRRRRDARTTTSSPAPPRDPLRGVRPAGRAGLATVRFWATLGSARRRCRWMRTLTRRKSSPSGLSRPLDVRSSRPRGRRAPRDRRSAGSWPASSCGSPATVRHGARRYARRSLARPTGWSPFWGRSTTSNAGSANCVRCCRRRDRCPWTRRLVTERVSADRVRPSYSR